MTAAVTASIRPTTSSTQRWTSLLNRASSASTCSRSSSRTDPHTLSSGITNRPDTTLLAWPTPPTGHTEGRIWTLGGDPTVGNQQLAALMTEAGFLDRSGTIGRKRFARAVTDAATHSRTEDYDRW